MKHLLSTASARLFRGLLRFSPWLIASIASSSAIAAVPNYSVDENYQKQSPPASVLVAQNINAAADGTGTVVTQTEDTFDVTGGTTSGSNLFHSFEQLDIETGQTVNLFSTPNTDNILGRVVNGNPSEINGLLQVIGSEANLFLINPAGIFFGNDAQVLSPGAFTATTADAVQFEEAWFNARGDNNYAELSSLPSGFAFINSEPSAVINSGTLTASAGTSITLLGGSVVNTGKINAPNGTVNIEAVPGEQLVRLTPAGSLLSLSLPVDARSALNAIAQPLTTSNIPALLLGGSVTEASGLVIKDGVTQLVANGTTVPTNAGTVVTAGELETSNAFIAANEQISIDTDINAESSVSFSSEQISLNASIETSSADISFNGPVFIGNDVRLSTGAGEGDITFGKTVNGVEGDRALTLFAGTGNISFLDAVGAYRELPGSNALTFQLTDINPNGSAFAREFTVVDEFVYFAANDGVHGEELWRSIGQGSEAVISLVKDIYEGELDSRPSELTNVNGTLYFSANDGINGEELWQAEGTSVSLVQDIYSGSSEFNGPNGSFPSELTNVEGVLFFAADDGINGRELWQAGEGEASLVRDIYPGSSEFSNAGNSSSPSSLANVGGTLFFAADDGINGRELWQASGTDVSLVADIYPGSDDFGRPFSSSPFSLTDVEGTLFFAANDGINGRELWRTEGTNVSLVEDIYPGTNLFGTANSSDPSNLTSVGGTLFFAANDGINGRELWRADQENASLVRDIYPGRSGFDFNGSFPSDFVDVDGTLFFVSEDGVNGRNLWRSDGTEAGTKVVAETNLYNSFDGTPNDLANINGELWFSTSYGPADNEIWISNGIPSSLSVSTLTLAIKDFENHGGTGANNVSLLNGILARDIDVSALGDITFAAGVNVFDGQVFIRAGGSLSADNFSLTNNGIVSLAAGNDVEIGGIRSQGEFERDGSVSITAGESIYVTDIEDGERSGASITTGSGSIELRAGQNIETGALSTEGFSTAVELFAERGDIQVEFIVAGSGGIDVEAAGSFRATGSTTVGFSTSPTTSDSDALIDFLVEQGYDRAELVAGNISLFVQTRPLSLAAVTGDSFEFEQTPAGELIAPISVRFGDASKTIVDIPYDISAGFENRASRILIQGDETQPFVIGPAYQNGVEFVPSDPQNTLDSFDPASPFEFTTNTSADLVFPSNNFPASASGVSAGIGISGGSNSALYGAVRASQIFDSLDNELSDPADGGMNPTDSPVPQPTGNNPTQVLGESITNPNSRSLPPGELTVPEEESGIEGNAAICQQNAKTTQPSEAPLLTINGNAIAHSSSRSPSSNTLERSDPCISQNNQAAEVL